MDNKEKKDKASMNNPVIEALEQIYNSIFYKNLDNGKLLATKHNKDGSVEWQGIIDEQSKSRN